MVQPVLHPARPAVRLADRNQVAVLQKGQHNQSRHVATFTTHHNVVFFLDADGRHYLEETTCVLCSGYNLGCVCRWTVAFAVAGVILLHLRWPIECCSCNQTRLVVVRVCVPGFFLFFISGKQYWSVQHLSADGAAFKSTRTLKPMVALRHKHASLFPPSLLLPPPPYSFATINATTCVRFSSNI